MATITLAVTVVNVSGANYYFIDGSQQAGISAIPGNTYKFDQADSSNSGHPLRLSITSNGTHAGGSAYTDGVTTSGTPGNAGAYTQIVVDATTVQTLYYYCTQHSNMGGPFNVGSSSTVFYKGIKGFTLQNVSSDPTVNEGQLWYNSASGAFKLAAATASGTWTTGGALGSARQKSGGAGTQTAGLIFAGNGPPLLATSEEYNGSSWTGGGTMGTARYAPTNTLGLQTAGLAVGGSNGASDFNNTEEYDGSSWTAGGNYPISKQAMAGAGTQTAGLSCGGGGNVTTTNEYGGSSWTAGGALGTGRLTFSGCGLQTAGLVFGGTNPPPKSALTEEYNGSSWTAGGNLNTARSNHSACGIQTAALCMGGDSGSTTNLTEQYDGTSWAVETVVPVARFAQSAGGTTAAAFLAGGSTGPANTTTTYEWTGAGVDVTKTITTS